MSTSPFAQDPNVSQRDRIGILRAGLAFALILGAASTAAAQGPQLTGQLSSPVWNMGTYSATLTLTNNGATQANNIQVTSLTAKPIGAAGSPALTSPTLPIVIDQLPAGSSTSVGVSFTVAAGISRMTVVEGGTLQDSGGNSYSFSISELATVPTVRTLLISSSGLVFASQVINTTSAGQSVNITNTGNSPVSFTSLSLAGANPGDFGLLGTCGASLNAGATCAETVTFAPTATGARSASLTLVDNASGSPQSVGLSGTGIPAPTFTLSFNPSPLTFTSQITGTTSSAQSVTISNTGNSAVNFSAFGISGANSGDFSISGNTCPASLNMGAMCSVSVTFSPTGAGSRMAALTVTDNASGSPQSVSLSGTGVLATRTLSLNPGSLTFATQNTGTTSAAQAVTVTNSGNSSVTFSSFALMGSNPGDFAVSANTCTQNASVLAPSASCSISITFSPTAGGARGASVVLTDNGTGSPQSIGLGGTGQVPSTTLSIVPGSLTFASQNVSTTSAAQGVTVTNTGNQPITFSSFSLAGANPGDFAISANTCTQNASTLASGSSCSISATFTPSASGSRTASILLADNANGSPQAIGLTGTGFQPTFTLSLNPGSLVFASQIDTTTSAAQSVTVTNTGNSSVTFTSFTLAGANPGDFAISANTCTQNADTLAAGGSCSISATFTPTAAGSRTASIQLADNATGSPQSIGLSGTGAAQQFTLTFNPGSLTFASQNLNTTSAAQSVTVTNTGNQAVVFTTFTLAGADPGDFTISTNTCTQNASTLAAGNSCSISATFKPTATGSRTASIQLADNATGSPQSIGLSGTGFQPTFTLSLNPGSLTFALQNTTTTSAAQSVTVTNTGNSSVTFTSFTLAGANPGDFAISANTCTQNADTLAAGGSCSISATFTPTAAGSRTASIQLADNATGSPQSIGLSGMGQVPNFTLTFNPGTVTFASQNLNTTSAAQSVTVTNTGNQAVVFTTFTLAGADPGDFTISANTCTQNASTLAAGNSCSISATFKPTATGSRTASIQLADNATGSPQSIGLGGTGFQPTFTLSLNPGSLTFASQVDSTTSAAQIVTVTNTGNSSVTFTSFTLAGANPGDFAISANTCTQNADTLAAGGSCSISATFTPTAAGSRTASIQLADNATGSPQSIGLSGTGAAQQFTLTLNPGSLTFASQNLNTTSAAQSVTVTNTGNQAVVFTTFTLAGADPGDFTISANTCTQNASTLAAGNSCSISATFKPTATGSRTASIQLADNATGSPQSIGLSGTGFQPSFTLSFNPNSLTFALQNTSTTSAAQGVTISNTGNSAITFTGFTLGGANPGDFSISTNTCPQRGATLAAGGSCSLSVTFTPAAAGSRTASISVADNAIGSPQSIGLSGTGQLATFTLNFSSLALTFAAQNTGTTSAAQAVSITNNGNSPITFTGFTLGGANAGDFAIFSNSCPLTPTALGVGAGCSVSVTFSPSAAGSRTASISVADNASGNPQSITLSGTGQTPVKSLSFNPSPLTFSNTVNTGTSAALPLTVNNTGNTPVTFTAFGLSGANAGDFSITSDSCPNSPATLAVGNSCSLQITFAPSAAGARTASVNFTDDATGSPQSVTVNGTGQVASFTLTFNPALTTGLTFAAQNLNTTSAAQSISISNTGNQPIVFSGFALAGANPGDFSITQNTCPSSPTPLAVSSACTVSITFTPTALNGRSAALSVTDNATGSPQQVPLSGTGQNTNKVLTFNTLSLAFPQTTVNNPSSPLTVSISNTGTAAVTFTSFTISGPNSTDFAITANTCPPSPATFAVSNGCSVSVTFTPSAAGSRTASLVFADDATGNPQSVSLTGTGQPPATTLSITPNPLTFPTAQNVGSPSAQRNITVSNTGNTPAQLNSFVLGGANPGDFVITQNTCPQLPNTLAASSNCTVGITFTPTAAGSRAATLVVTDNATGTPQSIGITGTGQAVTMTLSFSPASYNWSTAVNVGTTSGAIPTIYATANGTGTVTISNVQITGANASDFAFYANTCLASNVLTSGADCYVQITFTPGGAGARTANLTYTDNASGSPQTVALTGTGLAATTTLSFSANPVAYGATNVGSPSSQYLYVTNTGTAPLTFSAIAISGANSADFTINPQQSSCNTTTSVAGGSDCYVYITFKPSATGSRAASIQLTDNASSPASPQSVSLTGIGQSSSQIVVSPLTLTFAPQNQSSTSAAQAVTVYNTSGGAISFTSATLAGANPGDFNIAADTCPASIANGANCVIMVTFTPTATGSRAATLQIADGATNSPQSVSITGTGQPAASQTLRLYSPYQTFPNTILNTTTASGSYYVELINNGTGTITLGGFSIGGANPNDFAITPSTTCSPSEQLTPGNNCIIYLSFSPQAVGNRTATLNVSSSAVGSPQTAVLIGTGVSSTDQLRFSYTGITFSPQIVGTTASQTNVSVYNAGNSPVTFSSVALAGANAADFAITENTCPSGSSFAAGATCNVYVDFTPSAIGVRTASLVFTDSSTGSPQTVFVTGVGRSSMSDISLSYNQLSFSSTVLGTTSAQTYFYIYNVGTAPLTLNTFTLGGANPGDFAISENECVTNPQQIAAGGSCYVYLTFTPTAIGPRSATLQISDSASDSPQTVELSGIGASTTNVLDTSDSNLNFSNTVVGATTAQTQNYFYLYNYGNQPITISSIVITGANSGDFSMGQTTCPSAPATLAAGGDCYMYILFTPSAVGPRTASIQITDTAPDSPQSISLNGIGIPADMLLNIAPQSLSFSPLNDGSTTSATGTYFYIYNQGTQAVTFSSAFTIGGANASDFHLGSTTCGATLAAGGNCYQYVTFSPSIVGQEYATVQIASNATGSPQTVYLSGIGQALTQTFDIVPSAFVFASQALNTTSGVKAVYLYNEGTTAITFTSIALTGGNSGDFSISQTVCPSAGGTLAAGGNCWIELTFTPTASGIRTTTLQITDSASGSPQQIPVTGSANVPVLYMNQSELNFGIQNIGVISSNQGANIYNEGTGTLSISGISITGANASDFNITFNNCGSTLVGTGAGCTIEAGFTPSIVGPESASIQINDSAAGSPHLITLNGIGQQVTDNTLTLTNSELTFAPQNVSTTSSNQQFNIYNYGTGAISISSISIVGANSSDFGITFNNCGSSINAASGCTVDVGFTPTATGLRTASVQIASSATGSPQNVSLFGTGEPVTQDVVISNDTLSFPTTNVATTSSSQAFNIWNYGTGTLTFATSNPFTIVGADAGDFSITLNNCGSSLTTGAGCTIEVAMRPSAIGVRTAQLQIADSATGSPQAVNLTGTGQSATNVVLLSQTTLSFGLQPEGTTSTSGNFDIYNEGTTALTFASSNAFTITGPNASDFAISFNDCGSSLGANGAGCTVETVFTPSTAGDETATLNISDSSSDSPQTVTLIGTGEAPTQIVLLTYSSITFGPQNIGSTSGLQAVSIYNEGDTPLSFTGFTIGGANAGDFAISQNNCSSTLGPNGAGCTVWVTFTPTAVDARAATLQIADSATGSPQTVSLFGTGQTPVQAISFQYSNINFGAQTVGATSSAQQVIIYNIGNASVTLNSINIAGPNATEFAITNNNCGSSIAAGSACEVEVTFTPGAAGQRSATLQVGDTAPGSPQAVSLFGLGQ